MGFDGDAALALEVHRIEHLRHHFALGKRAGGFEKTVGKRAFAVVDMRDDREIPYEFRGPCGKMGLNPDYPIGAEPLRILPDCAYRPE